MLAFFFLSIGYLSYNILHTDRLLTAVESRFNALYSSVRRFGSYYNNADHTVLPTGEYNHKDVGLLIKANDGTDVKCLSCGIKKLRTQLETIAPDNIWTIAVFDNQSAYGYFDPMRPEYRAAFKRYRKEDVMERIVKAEGLDETYREFYGCNIRLSEPYEESGTDKRIRSIFYPIHLQKKLDALVVVDIKDSFINTIIDQYNAQTGSVINHDPAHSQYSRKLTLPCSDKGTIEVGIAYSDIVKMTWFPSVLIALLYYGGVMLFRRNSHSLQKDKMTNFYRRDYYEPRLKKQTDFSLLIIDIDHFKSINDTHGHKKGDDIIAKCAKRILGLIRQDDAAIRWGGDEFILSFTNMSPNKLADKGEMIRAAIAAEPIAGLPVTISVGGVYAQDTQFAQAYKTADAALYVSKRKGRNAVTVAQG
ncbi:GGDEF domain-containing protein [Photobacterium aphoticum]|nr:GGDEF domain-containing protein [Photobacterium aphoticum]PSU56320.1 GGDEF domain-containing protein [Photobacterium aphoticum]GHA55522.1 GGDEF domain-containing protein [Photobacterium aphoticum]